MFLEGVVVKQVWPVSTGRGSVHVLQGSLIDTTWPALALTRRPHNCTAIDGLVHWLAVPTVADIMGGWTLHMTWTRGVLYTDWGGCTADGDVTSLMDSRADANLSRHCSPDGETWVTYVLCETCVLCELINSRVEPILCGTFMLCVTTWLLCGTNPGWNNHVLCDYMTTVWNQSCVKHSCSVWQHDSCVEPILCGSFMFCVNWKLDILFFFYFSQFYFKWIIVMTYVYVVDVYVVWVNRVSSCVSLIFVTVYLYV
jgi:hypothetical protein